ncbi:MAG: site-specific integrase [bacterium]|nr:site-specific integrase [bacterium]
MSVEVAPPLPSAASSPSIQSEAFAEALIASPEAGGLPLERASDLEEGPSTDPLAQPTPKISPQDSIDFLLHPVELAKGRRAAENYLSSFRSEESRKIAEEALETLATVISGGKCDSVEFPWQQVQPYHGAAALTILKEKGAPARIETLRCRRDTTRSYRVVPDAYPARLVQKIRSTLSKVLKECCELGFVLDAEQEEAAVARSTKNRAAAKTAKTSPPSGRLLGDGELRALVAASAAEGNAEGYRDAVLFSLVYRGLKIAEITSLTPENVKFNNKSGACNIVARPSRGGGRGRKVALTNDELIVLEDWLDRRGDGPGPLLCTLGRGGKVEGKRLTIALLKEVCLVRAKLAKVPEFVPNDLSRSAESLTNHRKTARRKAARAAAESLSTAERALYLHAAESEATEGSEAIQFPFLGLKP